MELLILLAFCEARPPTYWYTSIVFITSTRDSWIYRYRLVTNKANTAYQFPEFKREHTLCITSLRPPPLTTSPYFNPHWHIALWKPWSFVKLPNLAYLPKIFQVIWRVKTYRVTLETKFPHKLAVIRHEYADWVTNMASWVVITAICKFCDTSPLSLWKRRR